MLARVTPAIVSIFPGRLARTNEEGESTPSSPMDRFFRPEEDAGEEPSIEGVGSGVIVSSDGLIITNHHVVTLPSGEPAEAITVELTDRRRFPAQLVGSDRLTDLALLRIESTGLPTLAFADSGKSRVGDTVFAVGNPFRVGLTVTKGIISALDRSGLNIGGSSSFEGFLQTDAPINPGNSGGALTDIRGRLVGINTAIFSQGGGNIGIGFAVPSNLARSIATRLFTEGKVTRGYFGARAESVDHASAQRLELPSISGVVVLEVPDGGPAASAGLKVDDVITRVNGKEVPDRGAFRLAISLLGPGEMAECSGFRQGKKWGPLVIELGGETAQSATGAFSLQNLPGITLQPADGGVKVLEVKDGSPLERKLQAGQMIVSANDHEVTGASSLEAALHRGVNTFRVIAGDRETTIVLRLE